jgi:hypothetical protein
MAGRSGRPIDLVERVARRRTSRGPSAESAAWRRETFCLPRSAARDKAREWFERYPKAAYQTEIEFWRELADDRIEFVMRRLPTAD